jgi:hypothetical protein
MEIKLKVFDESRCRSCLYKYGTKHQYFCGSEEPCDNLIVDDEDCIEIGNDEDN